MLRQCVHLRLSYSVGDNLHRLLRLRLYHVIDRFVYTLHDVTWVKFTSVLKDRRLGAA